ncbi:MAG TPA: right-handed parallel beta-helix repeat-containing protein [Acidobacteriota bacterium]|nr:right-handed parallel beta-helix repeat-containing protein [Acidobacteriota bacterium]
MKARWRLAIRLVPAVLLLVSVAASEAVASTDRFMYGSFYGLGANLGEDTAFREQIGILQDTLRFNMVIDPVCSATRAEFLIARGFNVFAMDGYNSEGEFSDFARGWHLVWQTDAASIPPWYYGTYEASQGRAVMDSVGGEWDTVWVVSVDSSDTAGWVAQAGGGNYKQRDSVTFGATTRHADYVLKAADVDSEDQVAILTVWLKYYDSSVYDTVAVDTVYGWEFSGGYDTMRVSWLHLNPDSANSIWSYYSLDWCGNGSLYWDEVLSTDDVGEALFNHEYDTTIQRLAEEYTYGTDGSYLLGWWVLDECSSSENALAYRWVDSVLRTSTGGEGAMQQWSHWEPDAWTATKMIDHEYFMRINYPARGSRCIDGEITDSGATSYCTDDPGGDSVSLQVEWDSAVVKFLKWKYWADTIDAKFWAKLGAAKHEGWCDGECFVTGRRPSESEQMAHCNLALACGADAITFWAWGWNYCYRDGLYQYSPSYFDIRDRVSPFIDSLGDVFHDLDWLGTDTSEAVASIEGSFIDSVRSLDYENPYIQVAFFEDTVSDDDYFMLVNRRCLGSESQDLIVHLDLDTNVLVVDAFTYDTVSVLECSGQGAFAVTLEPGQGKLFKMMTAPNSAITNYYYYLSNSCVGGDTGWVQLPLVDIKSHYFVIGYEENDTVWTGALYSGIMPYTAELSGGNGKLVWVEKTSLDTVAGSTFPPIWQGGISVKGNVTVDSNTTLTIRAPAEVYFDSGLGWQIDSYGDLTIQGYPGDTVFLRSAAEAPDIDDWDAVKHMGPGNLSVTYAQFRHCYQGLWLSNTASDSFDVAIDHCDFRYGELTGVQVRVDEACQVSISNSHFGNIKYYGVLLTEGDVTIEDNRFVDTMTNCVRITGASTRVSGGLIKDNVFDSLKKSNAVAIYLATIYDDARDYSSEENLIEDNTFGPTWVSSNQSAFYVYQCEDTLRFYRNAIQGYDMSYPGYGILNFNTRTLLVGDNGSSEALSKISECRYGLYAMSSMSSVTDVAKVRECSFEDNEYGVWVYSNCTVDLGTASDSGFNAFWGWLECSPPAECAPGWDDVYNVYNNNTSDTLSAIGNYWGNDVCPILGMKLVLHNPCWPYLGGSGEVTYIPDLLADPFSGGGAKLACDGAAGAALTPDDPVDNYPNPFNAGTVIRFHMAQAGEVEVTVFNVLGQTVRTLLSGYRSPGSHQVPWDGRDASGRPVASGVYLYRISLPDREITKKMVLVK